jgi:hypothetical protein
VGYGHISKLETLAGGIDWSSVWEPTGRLNS